MAYCRSLGYARDDRKERVAERERIVAKGESICWGDRNKKVTGSQDDDFVGGLANDLVKFVRSFLAFLYPCA